MTRSKTAMIATPERPALRHAPRPIIAHSPAMQQVVLRVQQYASVQTPVLLRGESGTGKDTIAHALHHGSPWREGPFVKLGCDHVSDEEVLFLLLGDVSRATQGPGALARAANGTLFLSEIGHFSLRLQQLLLQILQQKSFTSPVDNMPHCGDTRLVCASEVNLEQQVAEGEFLPELYYRLHVANIVLPPMRDRREDIVALVDDFFSRFNCRNHTHVIMTPGALAPLYICQWPDNLRDLENCLEYAVLHRKDDLIEQLPCIHSVCLRKQLNLRIDHYTKRRKSTASAPALWDPCAAPPHVKLPLNESVSGSDVDDDIRHRFIAALEKSGWVKAKAARLLNITPRQLYYALQKLNIEVRKF
ncbi:sigma 54-interacting transcriptional regulator [Klebsiella variicola]|uniref:sigma 54-interacting transcriptional regulator n=1 Tax=Klebsiella variicola TaxID=244366 RepID=UPI0034D328CF